MESKLLENLNCLVQGFSLWLNKGSRLQITWKIQHRRSGDMLVVLIKGTFNTMLFGKSYFSVSFTKN